MAKFRRFDPAPWPRPTVRLPSVPRPALFRKDFGIRRVDVVDNGVDTAYFRPGTGPRLPKRILFLGSLDWRPNLDAVDQLFKVLVPALSAARSQTPSFCWSGAIRRPRCRRRAADTPGVELHADVADVRPFLDSSAVMVVPLRIGGGFAT